MYVQFAPVLSRHYEYMLVCMYVFMNAYTRYHKRIYTCMHKHKYTQKAEMLTMSVSQVLHRTMAAMIGAAVTLVVLALQNRVPTLRIVVGMWPVLAYVILPGKKGFCNVKAHVHYIASVRYCKHTKEVLRTFCLCMTRSAYN